MELEFDGIKYSVTPIPPRLSPYSNRIAKLLKQNPASGEEADEISAEIKEVMDKLFAGTVKPVPREEHHIQIFNAVVDVTNKVLQEAGLFRRKPKLPTEKSNPTSPEDPQTSQ